MAGSGITLFELWRRMERHEADTRASHRALDDRVTALATSMVPREVDAERHRALGDRLAGLEEAAVRQLTYRRNLNVAIIAAMITSITALSAALLAVLAH